MLRIVRSAAPLLPGLAILCFAVPAPAWEHRALPHWQAPQEIAAGKGVRGPWQQNASRFEYVDDPTVAIDERGDSAVAWVDQARKDVFFQRFDADKAGPAGAPVNVSRSPEVFSWLPRIILVPQQVSILWQEIIFSGGSHGGDILFARSMDGGATFSEPINLSQSITGAGKGRINKDVWHNGSLDLAAGPRAQLYAAWTEYEGGLWIARSSDGGQSFSRPQRVAGDNQRPARAPSLALAADGGIYLAWTVGEDKAADIRIARSMDGGASFGEPQIVEASTGYSDAPKLKVDRDGILHLASAESAGGPFDRYHIRYTRSADGGRSFEPPRRISGTAASAAFPSIDIDAAGNVYVMWELFQDARQGPRGLGLAMSHDRGGSFAPPGVVPGSIDPGGGWNGSHQGLLMKKLAVNDGGSLAIVNSSMKPGERSRVWLIRGEMKAVGNR